MWTKKRASRPDLKKLTTSICLLLSFLQLNAQKMQKVEGHCGYYYKTMEDFYYQKQVELDFYRFIPGQTVASIGAQCGNWEAAYASSTDSIQFYLEDIDTSFFNDRQVAFAWHYYDSLRGSPMTSTYTMITGTEESTLLPENTFDKIIIINSFHEFTRQDEMLADIKTKLKPGGVLYIDEHVPRKQGQLNAGCKHLMLTSEEVISMLSKNGYKYIDGVELQFNRKNRPMRKIYSFRKLASP
jgi:predicted methyltransferase